jgi:CDP-glycerol glycerophosphotransferase
LLAGLPADTVLLLRFHHLVSAASPVPRHPQVLDVGDHPDIQALYLAADVMVTDYSSTMFDFAVTGRPMIFYTYDLADYRDRLRGFYFDLEQEAPGPLVTTTAELAAELNDLDGLRGRYAEAYDAFRQRYCHLDDGEATNRLIEQVFTR